MTSEGENKATKTVFRISRICLWVAFVMALATVSGRWAVNAEAFGARDLGLAVFLSFGTAATFVVLTGCAPILLLAGGLTWRFHALSARRFLLAGIVSGIPFIVQTWMS